MRPRHQARRAVNLANGSTAAGVLVAAAGRARLSRGPDGLVIGAGYRLPVPVAPAFTVGNVVLTRTDARSLAAAGPLLAHEARHATQYACCGGLPMIPAYLLAAAWSWAVTADFGARNIFERRAGLADGGYSERAARPALARWQERLAAAPPLRPGRRAAWPAPGLRAPRP